MKGKQEPRMHQFTFYVVGLDLESDEHVDALYEAGCDDATLSFVNGIAQIAFCREADTLKQALVSAYKDVRKAGVKGLEVLSVGQNNRITQAEIARRAGISRQRINQYIGRIHGPEGFPAPKGMLGDSPLWQWTEVSAWLAQHGYLADRVTEEAQLLDVFNSVLELRRQQRSQPKLARELIKSIL